MAIFRCNKCAHLEEHPGGWIGETIPCPKCGNPAQVYNSVFFVGKLLDKYFAAQREIAGLKAQIADAAKSASPAPIAPTPIDEIDLANTDQLASDLQHQPIHICEFGIAWYFVAALVFKDWLEGSASPRIGGARCQHRIIAALCNDLPPPPCPSSNSNLLPN